MCVDIICICVYICIYACVFMRMRTGVCISVCKMQRKNIAMP